VHYVSPAFERIWGRSVASLMANPHQWSDFILPEDRTRVTDAFAALTGNAPSLDIEYRIVRPDGEIRWVHVRGFQVRDTADKLVRHIGIVTDITARKQAELELAEASGRLDAMLENPPDFIYFKDRQSRLVRCSRAFANRFNLAESALPRGKTDFDLFTAEHAQTAYDDEQKIVANGEAVIGKLERETYADGSVTWALTTKMPWRDGTGAIVGSFGISKDVTVWKEAEAKLADTHAQLLQASRQAGMAEVATGVLHNVGNVLNSVNVSATLVADQVRHSRPPRSASSPSSSPGTRRTSPAF
jgi:PAS domain S-box-containing protein